MIYEWGDAIVDLVKTIRHFFRKLFCKEYLTYKGFGLCRKKAGVVCTYYWCPKRKERV